ncbi:MAG: hypothetical protein A2X94_08240 [Bdellovibrionales bacterium GWB1_55_8]|nr:MAG: hypothetical protein A2X94_08240 [Bdellovibrionales bacterium GWB1_55_8]
MTSFTILIGLLGLGFGTGSCDPRDSIQGGFHVYLTWKSEDTSRTMTVLFIDAGRTMNTPVVRYDTEARGTEPALYRHEVKAESWDFEKTGVHVHSAELKDLTPGATYFFAAGDADVGFSAERKFRTIPNDSSPLRFVVGGDMDVNESVPQLLQHAAALEPQFALIGGDIARDNGKISNFPKWDMWLKYWGEKMLTPQGFTVPMVLAVGNHEVDGLFGTRAFAQAPFFIGLFKQNGEKTYFTRTFGADTVVHVLDTGHIFSHGGKQRDWLFGQLTKHVSTKNRFALYHIPLYPSHRDFNSMGSRKGRDQWLPLFDLFGLTAGFESHDHALKRTKMLQQGREVSAGGTVYFGDGAWGIHPRVLSAARPWYVASSSATRHFWVVDVNEGAQSRNSYRAIGMDGKVLDEYIAAP